MKLFFSVGEPSGDLHGANLIRELRHVEPSIECVGYGGPKMADAGCNLHEHLTRLAVMWFARVLLNIHKFWALYRRAGEYFRTQRPDGVVLIDYPGFNWWIARAAKRHNIPVFYYGTPQLWAWAGWRVKKMRRLVDHVLCKLPFEEQWFRERGCNATYVGHPYFDELATRRLDAKFMQSLNESSRPLIALLPGSRTQEVTANLPTMLTTAALVQRSHPDVQFAIASFNADQANLARQMVQTAKVEATVHTDRTAELIDAATCALAVSGSVSLELLYHATPAAILYKISPFAFRIQAPFRKVRYITLANLLAVEDPLGLPPGVYDAHDPLDVDAPLPEYLTCDDKSERLAAHLGQWLSDEAARMDIVQRLSAARDRVITQGASQRAARYVVETLSPEKKRMLPAAA